MLYSPSVHPRKPVVFLSGRNPKCSYQSDVIKSVSLKRTVTVLPHDVFIKKNKINKYVVIRNGAHGDTSHDMLFSTRYFFYSSV